jgi:hypothetical protein
MSEPSRRELLKAVYKLDLYSFLQCSFGVLEPGNRFMPAAYLELLCAALMQVDARAVKRLIINTPPRHLKSFVTSVVFPAWLLMRDVNSLPRSTPFRVQSRPFLDEGISLSG